MWLRALVVTISCAYFANARCPADAYQRLPFVMEYAVWRGWQQALIFAPDLEAGCEWSKVRFVKCLSVNGIAASVDSSVSPRFRSLLGLIILTPRLTKNTTEDFNELLKKLNELEMNTGSFDWLISARSETDFSTINKILNKTAVRFDQNIVVGYPNSQNNHRYNAEGLVCDGNFDYKSKSNHRYDRNIFRGSNSSAKFKYEKNYYRATSRFKNLTKNNVVQTSGGLLRLYQAGVLYHNKTNPFQMTNITGFSLKRHFGRWLKEHRKSRDFNHNTHLLQYFKVRENSTLYAHYLGNWNKQQSMSGVAGLYPVDARNFLGEELVVGRCNSSGDKTLSLEDESLSSPALLDDVLQNLNVKLNTSSVSRYYSKLGFRTYEGSWTGLLGALLDRNVDLALEPVTTHPLRNQHMDFIFPIAETMCNIYVRQQETSTVRDIFAAPFSLRLVVSVVAVAVLAAIAIVVISRVAPTSPRETQPVEYSEALIWSTGILCQQGGTQTPSHPAASILLIVCLFFGVVTYNAYAAFITSVLSVRVASLDTVAAVLNSPDFNIGYIRNGADQMYLMSTKDAQLNAFYIRGYSNAENLVSSAEEGLARAAKQNYAFFAGQQAARATLRSWSQSSGKCSVRELPVHSSRAQLSFPLARRSPYAKPILISFLQLHNTGALARLEAALVPPMPECVLPTGFASARAADVRSALILITVGLISAATLGFAEYCWKNRDKQQVYIKNIWRKIVGFVHLNDCVI